MNFNSIPGHKNDLLRSVTKIQTGYLRNCFARRPNFLTYYKKQCLCRNVREALECGLMAGTLNYTAGQYRITDRKRTSSNYIVRHFRRLASQIKDSDWHVRKHVKEALKVATRRGFLKYDGRKYRTMNNYFALPGKKRAKKSNPQTRSFTPKINYKLTKHTKTKTYLRKYLEEFKRTRWNSIRIYTDGSKNGVNVGCSFVIGSDQFKFRLQPMTSVHTAELLAIYKALQYVLIKLKAPSVIILTDALSALKSIELSPIHPIAKKIRTLLKTLLHSCKVSVELCWIPAHAGIRGNEIADAAAKSAADNKTIDDNYICVDDIGIHLRHLRLRDD